MTYTPPGPGSLPWAPRPVSAPAEDPAPAVSEPVDMASADVVIVSNDAPSPGSFDSLVQLVKDDDQAGSEGGPRERLTGEPAAASSTRYSRKYKETKKMLRRRVVPIHAYIGPNGSGKSLAMVRDTLPSLDAGRRVLSTVMLLDSETGRPHPNYERLTEWSQLLDAKHCDVLFDEITGIAGSREAMSMPVQVQNLLNQLRRNDIVLRWSAPDWKRADTILRSVTQAVTVARGYMPDRKAIKGDGSQLRLWAPKRLFKLRTFSAVDFDEWTASKGAVREKGVQVKPLRPDVVEWFYGPQSRPFASYDTLNSVSRVGEVLDSGRCAHCGGKKSIPACSCAPTLDHVPERLRPHGRRSLPVVR
jgi:hypothetical protein